MVFEKFHSGGGGGNILDLIKLQIIGKNNSAQFVMKS